MKIIQIFIQQHLLMVSLAFLLLFQCSTSDQWLVFLMGIILLEGFRVVIVCISKLKGYLKHYLMLQFLGYTIILTYTSNSNLMLALCIAQLQELFSRVSLQSTKLILLYNIIAYLYILTSFSLQSLNQVYLPIIALIMNMTQMVGQEYICCKSEGKSPVQFTHRETVNDRIIVIESNIQSKVNEKKQSEDTPPLLQTEQNSYAELLNLFPQGIALYSIDNQNLILEYSNQNIQKLLRVSSAQLVLRAVGGLDNQSYLNETKEKSQENKSSISSFSTFQATQIPMNPLSRSDKRTLTNNPSQRGSQEFKRMSSHFTHLQDLKRTDSLNYEESLIEMEVRIMAKLMNKQDYLSQLLNQYSPIQEHNVVIGYILDEKNKKRTIEVHLYNALIRQKPMILFLIRDVTHRDYITALQEYSKYKSQTLSFVSHEYRNPLNQIISMLETGLDEDTRTQNQTVIYHGQIRKTKGHQSVRMSKYIKIALDNAKYLLNLSDDLLDLAQIKVGKFKIQRDKFNLQKLLENCLDLFQVTAEKQQIKLLLNYDLKLPRFVYSDSNRIKQIMINLLANAFKFTQQGQVIVKVGLICKKLEISVSDTGIGINQEDQTRLFQAFGRGNSDEHKKLNIKGVGLGLLISNQILQNLNEDLQNGLKFKSQVNKGIQFIQQGSTFYFSIQYKDPIDIESIDENSIQERNQDSESSVQQGIEQGDIKIHQVYVSSNNIFKRSTKAIFATPILIVDDIAMNIEALKNYIKRCGIDLIDSSTDGRSAVEKCRQKWKCNHDYYKLIFMDLEMPQMDGFQTTKAILEVAKQLGQKVNIVGCSGYLTEREKCLEVGMVNYLIKPIQFENLKSIVSKYL